VAGLLDQIAGLADTPQKRAALAALVGELEKNPAHPPERFNRGVRNVAGGMAKAIGDSIAFPRKYMETYQPGSMAADNPAATEWAAGTAMNMVGAPALTGGVPGMGAGIRAYHGSPHDFDRFDMSKIGTGEGAQAYGHGLYFAEKPEVARQYRDSLSAKDIRLGPHQYFTPKNYSVTQIVGEHQSNPTRLVQELEKYKATGAGNPYAHVEDAQKIIDSIKAGTFIPAGPGKMYEVSINAAPEQFLDWDRPLSGQSQHVRGALEQFGPKVDNPHARDATGARIYNAMQSLRYNRNSGASNDLREAGIPGIKYLDQGSRNIPSVNLKKYQDKVDSLRAIAARDNSPEIANRLSDAEQELQSMVRAASERTNNYVVFDDKIIEILRKYGLAGLAAMPALANAPQLEQAQ
jgi:hypothetical protein